MRIPAALLVVVSILTVAERLPGQGHAADSAAILRLIGYRTQAMRAHDAHAERSIYAPGAVWINAFGRRRVGPDSIEAFLSRLYADPGYTDSRVAREEAPEVWFIRPDVAVVHEYHEREGQRLANGSVIPIRRVHTTFVLSKEKGAWLVRYQTIGDQREQATTKTP